MFTFTVYKLSQDNTLSHKEHLNSWDEVGEFFGNNYDRMATVVVVQDQTDNAIVYTDNGEWYEVACKIKNFSQKRSKNLLTIT